MTEPEPEPVRRRGWSRRAAVIAVTGAVVVLVAAGVLATLGLGGAGSSPSNRRTGPAATVRITRQTLVDAVTLPGVLGYGDATPVTSEATGTVTALPAVGAMVGRGGELMRVDDQPVVLLFGTLPMYRALAEGAKGADVKQFEQNLFALGYKDFSVDDAFTAGTTAAVKRWQHSLGLPDTGTVDRGRVVYAAGPVRIASRLVRVGASATGDILTYTGNTRVVAVTTDASKAGWAATGKPVDLSAPGGGSARGQVSAVTPILAPANVGADQAASNPVQITIAFEPQDAFGGVAGAAVGVRYVVQQHTDVLTVPVNALLALAEGGYGVELVRNGQSTIVAVQVGLFADGRVEITGAGLRDGDEVGVPA